MEGARRDLSGRSLTRPGGMGEFQAGPLVVIDRASKLGPESRLKIGLKKPKVLIDLTRNFRQEIRSGLVSESLSEADVSL